MLKTLLKTILWGALAGIILLIAVPLLRNHSLTVPFPYKFKDSAYKDQTPKAPILILGDRMGKRLYEFSEVISKELSKGLTEPIQIQSWAKNGDGLHRVFEKSKHLNPMPKVVIYHGLTQEFLELRFHLSEMAKIQYNFDLYLNQSVKNAVYFAPVISKYIYDHFKIKTFSDSVQAFTPNKESKRQLIDIQALTYKIIEYELDEFISQVQDQGSLLILITTPINYEVSPQRACSATVTSEIQEKINSAEDYIARGLFKQGLLELESDILKNVPNPYLYYLRAKVHQTLNEYSKSMEMYKKAASFDCKFWRGNPILNNILRMKADEHDVVLFDFAQMVEDDFFINTTFLDSLYPQDLYYEKMSKALGSEIKKILNL